MRHLNRYLGLLGIVVIAAPAAATNLVVNGSFEGPAGQTPTGWTLGGSIDDQYLPVAIAYDQGAHYPYGAQGEAIPVDNAVSLSPDPAGGYGVYFVSDKAMNLSLSQMVYLTPGSYAVGFDSYDTFNGSQQPHDATLSGRIAGVNVANLDLAGTTPGGWTTHSGLASISAAGNYLVSFTFNTPDYPLHPDASIPGGPYNAKDVVIDRAYIVADGAGGGVPIPAPLPEPASWAMMLTGFAIVGGMLRARPMTPCFA